MVDPQVTIHEDQGEISPFWQRLPWFFVFPFQSDVLIGMAALSLASLLTHFVPVPEPVDFLLVQGLIWLAALRQAFGIMEAVSRGMLTSAERMTFLPDAERVNLPWKLMGIFLAWGMVLGLMTAIGRPLYFLASIAFVLSLPASVMALSVTNSAWSALSPGRLLFIIGQVGKPYLALLFFLILLTEGPPLALPLLSLFMGSWLALPVFTFSMLYFNLIIFTMMGYTMYQFHQALGLKVRISIDQSASNPASKVANQGDFVGAAIAQQVAEGNLGTAIDLAYEQQRQNPEDMAIQERYHKLLLLAEKKDRALSHGKDYLLLLMRKHRTDLALTLLLRLRGLNESFAPERPDHMLPLAEAAFGRRDPKTVVSLLRGFDKLYPRHTDIPGVYLLSARTMSELMRQDASAIAILRGLKKKFPGHTVTVEAENYLLTLEKLQAANVQGNA